ncbi:MAG: site-2 protease family protein [Pseudonocardiales bacterium]|nr:MAG: site-2 protease family protein [Pseudonocardiales bacterium]
MPEPSPPTRSGFGAGFPVGRVLGVPVFVSPSALLLVAFIALTYTRPGQGDTPGWPGGYAVGAGFAVLLLLSVFLHELGHCVVSQAVGVPVRSITLFLLGGITRTDTEARDPTRSYLITFAGPLVSLCLGAFSALAAEAFGRGGLGGELFGQLAWVNLIVAVFNMLPGLPLDGGQLVRAGIWRRTGNRSAATRVAGWSGRVVSLLVFAAGFLLTVANPKQGYANMFWLGLLAAFIWVGATQAMRNAVVLERLPRLQAGSMARPAVAVRADLPLSEALRRLAAERAGAIVVVDGLGRPDAVVNEQAVAATPEQRRPWVTVATVARSIADGLTLAADLSGNDVLTALQAHPATEYIVVDADGGLVGVLAAADLAYVLSPVAR